MKAGLTLSRQALNGINTDSVIVPQRKTFSLPEKIIQFGTGVLLRGLIDYFVDKANRHGIFNGRVVVVVVKSTSVGERDEFVKTVLSFAKAGCLQGLHKLCPDH